MVKANPSRGSNYNEVEIAEHLSKRPTSGRSCTALRSMRHRIRGRSRPTPAEAATNVAKATTILAEAAKDMFEDAQIWST